MIERDLHGNRVERGAIERYFRSLTNYRTRCDEPVVALVASL